MKLHNKKVALTLALAGACLAPSLLAPSTAQAQHRGEDWQRRGEDDRGRYGNRDRSSVTWRGRVDDVVDVYFQARRSWTRRISGNERTTVAEADFSAALPHRAVRLMLDKQNGRGRVSIRQQPDRNNGYTCIVRVEDRDPGADRYRFSLDWGR